MRAGSDYSLGPARLRRLAVEAVGPLHLGDVQGVGVVPGLPGASTRPPQRSSDRAVGASRSTSVRTTRSSHSGKGARAGSSRANEIRTCSPVRTGRAGKLLSSYRVHNRARAGTLSNKAI